MDDQRKDPQIRSAPNNYRPIMCLLISWKILTTQTSEGDLLFTYKPLTIPEKQKGCRKGTRGTRNILYIDQHILKNSKTRRQDEGVDWLQKGILHGLAKVDNTVSKCTKYPAIITGVREKIHKYLHLSRESFFLLLSVWFSSFPWSSRETFRL